jgi:hypothetical protein
VLILNIHERSDLLVVLLLYQNGDRTNKLGKIICWDLLENVRLMETLNQLLVRIKGSVTITQTRNKEVV